MVRLHAEMMYLGGCVKWKLQTNFSLLICVYPHVCCLTYNVELRHRPADAMGRQVDGWDKQNKRYTEPWDEIESINGDNLTSNDDASEEDELGLNSDAMTAPEYEEEYDETTSATLLSTSSDDVCEYNEETNKWTSSNSLDECPVEPNISFMDALKSRANWLVGLLALQSCSGFILARNEALLQDHPVIVYFLTMLVGAGGNAGNQASVRGEYTIGWTDLIIVHQPL